MLLPVTQSTQTQHINLIARFVFSAKYFVHTYWTPSGGMWNVECRYRRKSAIEEDFPLQVIWQSTLNIIRKRGIKKRKKKNRRINKIFAENCSQWTTLKLIFILKQNSYYSPTTQLNIPYHIISYHTIICHVMSCGHFIFILYYIILYYTILYYTII